MEINKLRKTLQSYSPEYHEEDWQQMKEMLEEKERRRGIFFMLPASAFLIAASLVLFFGPISDPFVHSNSTIKTPANPSLSIEQSAPIPPDNKSEEKKIVTDPIKLNATSSLLAVTKDETASKATHSSQAIAIATTQIPANLSHIESAGPTAIHKESIDHVAIDLYKLPMSDIQLIDYEMVDELSLEFTEQDHIIPLSAAAQGIQTGLRAGAAHLHRTDYSFGLSRPGMFGSMTFYKNRWNSGVGLAVYNKQSFSTDEVRIRTILGDNLVFNDQRESDPTGSAIGEIPENYEYPVYSDDYVYFINTFLNYNILHKKFRIGIGFNLNYSLNIGEFSIGPRLDLSYQFNDRIGLYCHTSLQDNLWMSGLGMGYQFKS